MVVCLRVAPSESPHGFVLWAVLSRRAGQHSAHRGGPDHDSVELGFDAPRTGFIVGALHRCFHRYLTGHLLADWPGWCESQITQLRRRNGLRIELGALPRQQLAAAPDAASR